MRFNPSYSCSGKIFPYLENAPADLGFFPLWLPGAHTNFTFSKSWK